MFDVSETKIQNNIYFYNLLCLHSFFQPKNLTLVPPDVVVILA